MSEEPPSDDVIAEMNPATDEWAGSLLRLAVQIVLKDRPSSVEVIYGGSFDEVLPDANEECFLIGVRHWDECVSAWRQPESSSGLLFYLLCCIEKAVISLEHDARLDPARLRGRERPRYQ